MMESAGRSEQEDEDITTEYMLKMVADIPLENVDIISQTLERCRSRLDGLGGASRLLGPETLCPRCSTPWLCGRYRAELRPRPTATKPLRRLLNKRREGRPMGRVQTRLLDRFLAAKDLIVLECQRCSQVTKLPIVSRSGRGKANAGPSQVPTPATPGITPSGSGRRRSRARDKNAGLVIPASLRTPCTAASRPAAAAETPGTPGVGQSPCVRVCPPSDVEPETADGLPGQASAAPIALKKARAPLPRPSSPSPAVGLSTDANSAPISLKKSRPAAAPTAPGCATPGRRKGRGGVSPSPATPVAPVCSVTPDSAASKREKQRRLQKILAQADCRRSSTGLMAFLSEL